MQNQQSLQTSENPQEQNNCKESTSTCTNIQNPKDLKLRTIVAGPNCETHKLSNFIDVILKPIFKHIPSLVRDDLDLFIHHPTHKDIVSFDVVNFYTMITHQYGIEAIGFWLKKIP